MLRTIISRLRLYYCLLRFDKPIGTFLLLWPTLVALWIANIGKPKPLLATIFVCGTILLRAAGCIFNDLADRKFDQHVARTQHRPLANGKISVIEALILAALLLAPALYLVLLTNKLTVFIAIIGFLLTLFYPFAKRFTQLPQVILGITFNLGVPMAFAATLDKIPLSAWVLYIIALLWTVAYDTMYGMVDREDDIRIGIKSTAILFGRFDCLIIAILQLSVFILLLLLGKCIHATFYYYLMVIITGACFVHQQKLIHTRDTANYLKAFSNNNWAWRIIFFGIFLNFPIYL